MHKNSSSLLRIGITIVSLLFFSQPSMAQPLTSQALETFTFKESSYAVLLN